LRIVVTEQGTTTTIAVDGEWDLTELQASRAAIRAVLEGCPECIVLDLSQLSFIDSTGLHIAVELHKRCTQQNVRLVIVPGPRAVQRIFEICRLTELLPFVKRPAVT
jgi:anti-anti-sigma factor